MRMFRETVYTAAALVTVLLLLVGSFETTSGSSLGERLLRRQSNSNPSEAEQESTTQVTKDNNNNDNGNNQPPSTQLPPRLYPDLPRAPVGVFGQPPNHMVYDQGPPPFNPFGRQLRPMPPMQPRPISPSERIQSESFTNGLGRRLLSMVGIEMPPPGGSNETDAISSSENADANARRNPNPMDETMKALRNSTVLQQLNRGVHSIYGSLSKMYNSTVQQQLDLLQDRFKKESENSTNPWQQRMAQQVPQFFKSMATRVNEAQENLNRVWQQVTQASNGSQVDQGAMLQQANPQSRSFFNMFDGHPDNFNGGDLDQTYHPGNFLHQIGRSFGFNDDPMGQDRQQGGGADLGSQIRAFWMNQVQPQIGMLRGQIARVWRDLSNSGALPIEHMLMGRSNSNNLSSQSSNTNEKSSSDLVDNILKEVDMTSQDIALVEPKSDQQPQQGSQEQQQRPDAKSGLGMQMQNRLIAMQRDLNQLWSGLSSSLQNALGNVRNTMNPQPQFSPMDAMPAASNKKSQEVDQAENEIEGTIKDLSKLQKDADIVHDVVQRQQQQAQRQNIGSRFRNFFNDVDLNIDQLPARFGDSVTRLGNAVGDIWHQIPRRWDNFMQNRRPEQPDMVNARVKASNDTQKP